MAEVALVGRIRPGLGIASQALAIQLPTIAREFPEVAACRPASINIELELPLMVIAPDHRTRRITWTPGQNGTEAIDLLRVDFEAPLNAPPVPAWLYIPHNSPYRRMPHVHEVIAPPLDLQQATSCRIRFNRAVVQMPWSVYPVVLVM